MGVIFGQDSSVLLIGDSITDAGRNRDIDADMGKGFALIAVGLFAAENPELRVQFANKGLGGNTVQDLKDRWEEDCIKLKPDWVSILIGVNDTWKFFADNRVSTFEDFESNYRWLLEQIKERLGSGIILVEPFLFSTHPEYDAWRKDLNPRIEVVRKLAREFQTRFVPMDGIFAEACTKASPEFWTRDGVHLTNAGCALLAKSWLKAVKN